MTPQQNPVLDQSQRFEEEKLVVITSKVEIDMMMWRKYLEDHFTRLITRKNSKIYVLGGIHGGEDGRIGKSDKGLLRDITNQIRA